MQKSQDGGTVEFIICLVSKISFLPNYCVKYYEYIVKWSSGVAFDCCASLDIAYIVALRYHSHSIVNYEFNWTGRLACR